MLCPKCHTELKDDVKVCSHCKTKINSSRNQSKGSSFSLGKKVTKDEDYIKAYMGKNNHTVANNFSIYAAALGPFYLIYRKMYKQAFIMILIYIMTYFYLSEDMGIITRLTLNILLGLRINTYYYQEVIKKVESIKNKNPNTDSRELVRICAKKGGNLSVPLVILCFVLYIILISLGNKSMNNRETHHTDYSIYSMTYDSPPTAQITAKHTNYQHFTDKKHGTCAITITGEKTNISEEEYYKRNKENYQKYIETTKTEKKINHNTWYYIKFESTDSNKELFIKKEKTILYTIIFESFNSNACTKDIDTLLKSVKFQKNF